MRRTLLAGLAVAALAAAAERQPFERYQSILDRQMFGVPPKGFDPTKLPSEVQKTSAAEARQLTQEQEKLQRAVHFSVFNVNAAGESEVGFTDNSDPKAPKHYYLKVGQSQDGWTVREADPEKASMTLVKDDIELPLTLGDNTSGGKGGGKGAAPGKAAGGGRGGLGGERIQSLRARRQQRAQAEAAQREQERRQWAQQNAERDARAAEEKAQRDQERAEQRKQLLAIQEELKMVREERRKQEKEKPSEEGGDEN